MLVTASNRPPVRFGPSAGHTSWTPTTRGLALAQSMRRGATAAVAAAAIVGALLAFLSGPALAADPVQIIDIDAAPREVEPGSSSTFSWTLRNLDILPYDISVVVQAPTGWAVSVSPANVAGLAPNRAVAFQVTLTAPLVVHDGVTATARVLFTVTDGSAPVYIASRNATATIPSAFAEKRVVGIIDNPLPAPLDNEWGVFLLDVMIWLAISLLVRLALDPVVKKLVLRTKTEIDDIVLRIVKTPLIVVLFLFGTVGSLSALDRHLPAWLIEAVQAIFGFALALIIFYLGYRIFKDVVLHMARGVAKRTASPVDDVLLPIIEKVGLIVIGLAAFGLLLGFLNIDLTLFVAGGVVTSMVVAFAAQDTLSNFFAGMFLLTDRPFKVGDTVILPGDDWVEVRAIGMRTSRFFRFSDASLVTIPNNKLVNEKLANFTNPRDQGRVMMKFSAGYGSDPAKVKSIINDVISKSANIVTQDPYKPVVRFDAMADSSLVFFVLVWIDHRDNRFMIQDYLNTEIYRRFNDAGIEIPFPQRTVHFLLDAVASPRPKEMERLTQGVAKELKGRRATGPTGPPAPTPEQAVPPDFSRAGEPEARGAVATPGPMETVEENYDALVGPAASVRKDATLGDAIKSMLAVPATRKVYVVADDGGLLGLITIEALMRHAGYRLGARETGITSFLRFLRDMESDAVESFMASAAPITKETRLVDVARKIVEHRINDFPVVDAQGRLVGELNSLKLLEAVLALFRPQA